MVVKIVFTTSAVRKTKQTKNMYRHSLVYAFNVGTHKKNQKQKPCKSRLLRSAKGEEIKNRGNRNRRNRGMPLPNSF